MHTADGPRVLLRPALDADGESLLGLNLASEAVLSPLTAARLASLIGQAWYQRVACLDGHVQAFLIALGPGADYDSPNYRWFAQHYDDFVYVDRVVVAAPARQAGLASLLYEDLMASARAGGIARITCEVDIEPPNAASLRFHERFGFAQVGTQWVAGGKKRVSLRELPLGLPGARPAGHSA